MSSKHISKCSYKFFCLLVMRMGRVVITVGVSPWPPFWVICLPPSENAQSCLTLWDPMDSSLPGSSVRGFSRQGYWSGLPFPSPGDFPTRDQTRVFSIAGIPVLAIGFVAVWAISPAMLCWKLVSMKQELLNIFPSQRGPHTASNWLTEIFF